MTRSKHEKQRLDEIVDSEPIESAKFNPQGRADMNSVPTPNPEAKGKAPKGDEA